nr:CTTNBP2 N-terminal-like protein [Ipomoea batatas]
MIYEILRKKGMRLRKQKNVRDYRVLLKRFGLEYGKKGSLSKCSEGDQEAISTAMSIVPFEQVIEQPAEDVYRLKMPETLEIEDTTRVELAGVEVQISKELQKRISSQPLAETSDVEPVESNNSEPASITNESAPIDALIHEHVMVEKQPTMDEDNLVDVVVEEDENANGEEGMVEIDVNQDDNLNEGGEVEVDDNGRDQEEENEENSAENEVRPLSKQPILSDHMMQDIDEYRSEEGKAVHDNEERCSHETSGDDLQLVDTSLLESHTRDWHDSIRKLKTRPSRRPEENEEDIIASLFIRMGKAQETICVYVIHWTSQTVAARARYSASEDERDTVICFFDLHDMRDDPRKMQKPVIDLRVSLQAAQSESENTLSSMHRHTSLAAVSQTKCRALSRLSKAISERIVPPSLLNLWPGTIGVLTEVQTFVTHVSFNPQEVSQFTKIFDSEGSVEEYLQFTYELQLGACNKDVVDIHKDGNEVSLSSVETIDGLSGSGTGISFWTDPTDYRRRKLLAKVEAAESHLKNNLTETLMALIKCMQDEKRGYPRGSGSSSESSLESYFVNNTSYPDKVWTMQNLPTKIKKLNATDEKLWVDEQNRLEGINRKKTEMWNSLRKLVGVDESKLRFERSFGELINWFEAGVLPGRNLHEAFENYMKGRLCDEAITQLFKDDFFKLREKKSTE